MIKRIVSLVLASACLASASTKSVYQVWQPLSLHGTDVSSVAGKESGVDYTVLMSRPVVLSGALPEDLVYAVARSHKIDSNGNYDIDEANLLALSKIKLNARFDEKGLAIQLDVSSASLSSDVEVSLFDVVKLGIEALRKTLDDYGQSYLSESMPCSISVIGTGDSVELKQLESLNVKFKTSLDEGE